jgi:hypothetical protein
MQPTCCYDTARRLAEHWMEALLLVQVVVLGATWLIPRLAQHAPTQMEVNDPSVFGSTHKDQLIKRSISLLARHLAKYRGLTARGVSAGIK